MTGKGDMSLAHGIEVTRDGKQGTLSIIQESYTNNRKICHGRVQIPANAWTRSRVMSGTTERKNSK